MKRKISATVAVLAVLLVAVIAAVPARAQGETEAKIDSLLASYDDLQDAQAKLDFVRRVLAAFPESRYTAPLLDMAKEHCAELERMDEFILLAQEVRGRVESADVLRSIDRVLVATYGEMKDVPHLNEAVAQYIGESEEKFNLFFDLIRAYTEAEAWEPVLQYAERARPLANAEAFKKEFPDRKISDEDLAQRGRNRQAILLTYAGWAKANTGRQEEALDDFQAADKLSVRTYMGFSDGKLDYFWGTTLAGTGDLEAALSRFAPLALYAADEGSQKAMKEAYVKKSGSDAGYDSYLNEQRLKHARTIDDFTLARYDSTMLSLSAFKGKVLLVSFWFPT
ncbi:MAG: hypothetical protein HY770_08560 [Chitinivibrionia bacterium]|nr:hypothetical protein [Chitinivibrionia bacterium]